ncbi:hypothetical protein Moror_15458 [Moniliophthora roreri MCA 2997]|nr:hypothetical protein Moror_15458 [Moniliophthora roreri MCA 2997]
MYNNDNIDVNQSTPPPTAEYQMKSNNTNNNALFVGLKKLISPSASASSFQNTVPHPGLFAIKSLQEALSAYAKSLNWFDEEVDDDLKGERHSMGPKSDNVDDGEINIELLTELNETLKGALTGVTEGTAAYYHSLMKQFVKFLVDYKYIKPGEEFFCKTPHENAAELICA